MLHCFKPLPHFVHGLLVLAVDWTFERQARAEPEIKSFLHYGIERVHATCCAPFSREFLQSCFRSISYSTTALYDPIQRFTYETRSNGRVSVVKLQRNYTGFRAERSVGIFHAKLRRELEWHARREYDLAWSAKLDDRVLAANITSRIDPRHRTGIWTGVASGKNWASFPAHDSPAETDATLAS